MKHKLLFVAILITFCFFTASAQEVISLGGDKNLQFVVPNEFKLVPHDKQALGYSYYNESKTKYLDVFVSGVQLVPEDLEKQKEEAIGFAELAFPDLKWLKRETINRNGRKWALLSYEIKNENGATIRFDDYITSIELSLVQVMFALKTSDSEAYKVMQQEVIKSFKFYPKATSNRS